MADIRIGEKVVNRNKGIGTIVSTEGGIITVEFQGRETGFRLDAFEKGFLQYENPAVQEVVNEEKRQAEEKAAQILAAKEKSTNERRKIQEELSKAHRRITVLSATFRLDPAPITMTSVRKKDQDLIRDIFAQCDKQTQMLFDSWKPDMEYLDRVSYGRSKYCVGYLCKYADTYVFRLFSRNDQYSKNSQGFITVKNSNTSEVLRVLRVNGKLYYFSKNLASAGQFLVNTKGNGNWHVSDLNNAIMVNHVIRVCDCAYLNDHIAVSYTECLRYLKLLFAGLHNNKAEIVLKHKLFGSAYCIADLETYLEAFTHKQITAACSAGALNTLPLMTKFGNLEPEVLQRLETVMRRRRDGRCLYTTLEEHISRLGIDTSDLDRRLIGFLKNQEHFQSAVYEDYINLLTAEPGVGLADFFDKDYQTRHRTMVQQRILQKKLNRNPGVEIAYAKMAEELSWIDREENDYYILIPKTIDDFYDEGAAQHNCVFTCEYYRAVIDRQSIIVFLRKEKDKSFVTIEYDYETFEVWQAFGKYNSTVSPELYEYIVNLGKRLNYEMHSHQ